MTLGSPADTMGPLEWLFMTTESLRSSSSTRLGASQATTDGRISQPIALIDPCGDEPIRAELLGLERLEAQARLLARAAALAPPKAASSPLLGRLVENRRLL